LRSPSATVHAMQTRRLGRTGHHSSLAILGAAAFWDATAEVAAAAFERAMAAGVNHLDVAPQYGKAQELLGPLLPAVRDRLFVACKTLRHQADGVRAQLEESLELLGCEQFDLYQLHGVTDLAELDRRADAVRAITAARDEGLCRFFGITGHNLTTPVAQLEAIRRYDVDTVMFPVNARLWADPVYRRDAEALLAAAAERDVGVMAIKTAAARPWGDRPHTSGTWYDPYTAEDEVRRSVRFTLSVDGVHALCTPGDVTVLDRALDAAAGFTPMSPGEMAARSSEVAGEPMIFPMPVA